MNASIRVFVLAVVLVTFTNAHGEMFETNVEFSQQTGTLGEFNLVTLIWEAFGPAGSIDSATAEDIRNMVVYVNKTVALVPDIPVQLWIDDVLNHGVPQPIGGEDREIVGIEWFCSGFAGVCLPDGLLFFDNDIPVVQQNSTSGETTFNIFTGEVGVPLNTGGVFVFVTSGLTINEWNNGVMLGSHFIETVRVTTTQVVPIPAAVWLFITGLGGLAVVRKKQHKIT